MLEVAPPDSVRPSCCFRSALSAPPVMVRGVFQDITSSVKFLPPPYRRIEAPNALFVAWMDIVCLWGGPALDLVA